MAILFADDDDFMTKPIREKLQVFESHEIVYAKEPVKALDEFASNPSRFEAIVLDIMMPHCDVDEYKGFSIPRYFPSNPRGRYTGLKLLLQIREITGKGEEPTETPIIILTAVNRKDIENYLKELNVEVDAVVNKPVLPTEFAEILKGVISPNTGGNEGETGIL